MRNVINFSMYACPADFIQVGHRMREMRKGHRSS